LEKSGLDKTSALKLLSYLTEETRLMVFRDLNRPREEKFAGKLREFTARDEARLKMLEAIEKEQKKEQSEQPEPLERRLD
jgi:hypothetical protein